MATTRVQHYTCGNNRCKGIISYLAQMDTNKERGTTSFINGLEI